MTQQRGEEAVQGHILNLPSSTAQIAISSMRWGCSCPIAS